MRLDRTPDAERVSDAVHVLTGGRGTGSVRAVVYGAYVALLVGATYGFTVAQAVFRTSDPAWLRAQLTSPLALGIVLLLAALGVVLVHLAAAVRGAVVPPTPWTDLVVASPNDRAVTLRRWWLVSLSSAVIGGTLGGAILGAAAWYAGLGGVVSMVVAMIVGGGYGLLLAIAWLSGQARRSTRRAWATPTNALRGMRVEDLRAQAARSATLGGSILSGDLRAARFELTAPVTHARLVRLKPRGPVGTVVARDVLGLRRAPVITVVSIVTLAVALGLLGWTVAAPAVPMVVGFLAGALAHLGASGLAEGMRQQADNLGSPALLGVRWRREASAHGVVVAVAVLAGGILVLVPAAVLTGGSPVRALLATLIVTTALLGSVGMASFRGPMPRSPFAGSGVPTALVGWYSFPSLAGSFVIGTAANALAERVDLLFAALPGAVSALALVWVADRLGARLERAHRG